MKKIFGISIVVLLLLVGAGCGGEAAIPSSGGSLRPPPITGPVGTSACVHSTAVKYSATEEPRMKEIMLSVMQGGADMPTDDLYNEFWSILERYGRLCDEDIDMTKTAMLAAEQCSRIFYKDALQSLRAGQSYKSPERLNCESKTFFALLSEDKARARITANDELIRKIAAGEVVNTPSGDVVFTEEIILSALDNIAAHLARADKLLTRKSVAAGQPSGTQQPAPVNAPSSSGQSVKPGNLALDMPASASDYYQGYGTNYTTPSKANDGDINTYWTAGGPPPQWWEVDLSENRFVDSIELVVAQKPSGIITTHEVWAVDGNGSARTAHTFSGLTSDYDVLSFNFDPPLTNIAKIMVKTTSSQSWVGWREVRVFGSPR